MDIRAALKGQYHAALAMLKDAMEHCPDGLWDGGGHRVPFWRVAYHTLHGTHMYLQADLEAFRPWEHHIEDYNDLPWPPGSGPVIDRPYTKTQLLDYWRICDAMVDASVDALDLDAAASGFPWHKMIPKLEHQLHNLRHIQHHTALLSGRLRVADGTELPWVRTGRPVL